MKTSNKDGRFKLKRAPKVSHVWKWPRSEGAGEREGTRKGTFLSQAPSSFSAFWLQWGEWLSSARSSPCAVSSRDLVTHRSKPPKLRGKINLSSFLCPWLSLGKLLRQKVRSKMLNGHPCTPRAMSSLSLPQHYTMVHSSEEAMYLTGFTRWVRHRSSIFMWQKDWQVNSSQPVLKGDDSISHCLVTSFVNYCVLT